MKTQLTAMLPNTLARVPYAVRFVLFALAVIPVRMLLMNLGAHLEEGFVQNSAIGLTLLLMVALYFCAARYIVLPRVRDVGLHDALLLLTFVPLLGLLCVAALLFVATDAFKRPTLAHAA